jgi:hypothetical protein
MTFALATFLKPFIMFALTILVLYPARMAVKRHMKDGKLKNLLMFRVGGDGVKWTPKLVVFWAAFLLLYLGAFLLLVV